MLRHLSLLLWEETETVLSHSFIPPPACLCPSSPSSSTISTFSSVCCFSIFHYLLCSSSPCRLTTFLPTHKAQCCANKHCQWQPLLYCREISGLKRAQFWTWINMRWNSAFNSRLISHAIVRLISFFFIYLCTSSAHICVYILPTNLLQQKLHRNGNCITIKHLA